MKTLYIHIGHYKTGTSAIQKYCSENAATLAQNGYYYPPVARPPRNATNHGELSLTLAGAHGFKPPPWYGGGTDIDEVYREFQADVTAAAPSNILVSSEEFMQLALRKSPGEAICDLRDRLAQFDVRILLYIREPMALLKSWYNEVNKGPYGTRTFPVFFKNLDSDFLSQWHTYDRFAEVFGSDRMIVRSYKYTGMDHIRDFLSAIGYAPLPTGTDPISAQEAQDLQALELARLAKKRTHSYEQATLSQFGNIKALEKKVDGINADFAKLSGLSDVPLQSELSLLNVFRHLEVLITSLKEQKCTNDKEADILRNAALRVEGSDPDLALVLMRIAHVIRPHGRFIKKKLQDYEARLVKVD